MSIICPLFSGSTGNSTYLSYENTGILVDAGMSCKGISNALLNVGGDIENIKAVVVTHEHTDHIKGLKEYNNRFRITNFYCVQNEATKDDESDDFKEYCKLRDGKHHFYLYKGCSRKWMNESDETRGSAGLTCIWPDISNDAYKEALKTAKNGGSPNNISPIIKYSIADGATFLWMGDLETEFQENIRNYVAWPKVDILFAPHHGRDSGKIPEDVLRKLNPKIIVIGEAPCKDLNYYNNYNNFCFPILFHISSPFYSICNL